MALSREITLTIDNYNITLDKEIKIYEYDAINLCFTIQEYGIVMRDGKAHNRTMPVVALKAYMLIETPQGVDSVEATNIVRNKVIFSLGNKYSQFVGVGKMQIILRDLDGCRITLPEFNYEVKQSINTGWEMPDVLIGEKEFVITDELGRPVETTKISEMDEVNEVTPQTYTVVINEDGNKKIKLDTIIESIGETIEFDVEEIDRRIDEMIEVYDDEEIEVEFPSLHNDVERIKSEINEISESLDNIVHVAKGENIAKSINELIEKGFKRIKLPSGNFGITESIVLKSNVEIYGNRDTVLVRNMDIPIIKTLDNALVNECYLHDLTFKSVNIFNNRYYDLELCNANMFKLNNIKVEGVNVDVSSLVGLNAYKIDGYGTAYSLNMDKLDFRNASLIVGITDSYLSNSNIWSQGLYNCVWLKCSSHQILNCQFVGNDINGALRCEDENGDIIELIKVNNCYFDGSYSDINSGNAINLKNVFNSVITNNNIWKQKRNGMIISGCDGIVISNNTFRDNGISDDKEYSDIIFEKGSQNCIVSDNVFVSLEGTRKFKTKAIDLSISSLVANSTFTNNLVRENDNYSDTPFNFDETRLATKGNVFINNRKGETTSKAHTNKIVGDLELKGKIISKSGMLLNYNFYKDDFDPSLPLEVENGTKRRSTVVTKNGQINGLAYNISLPLTANDITLDINVNGSKKDTITIKTNAYTEFVKLPTPINILSGQAISLTLRGSGTDTTLRQIQFTIEYEII